MAADATCRTCPWCELGITGYRPTPIQEREGKDGRCRRNPPRHYVGPTYEAWAEWPVVDPDQDWCGCHPDRKADHG